MSMDRSKVYAVVRPERHMEVPQKEGTQDGTGTGRTGRETENRGRGIIGESAWKCGERKEESRARKLLLPLFTFFFSFASFLFFFLFFSTNSFIFHLTPNLHSFTFSLLHPNLHSILVFFYFFHSFHLPVISNARSSLHIHIFSMLGHIAGRPSPSWDKIQAVVVLFMRYRI